MISHSNTRLLYRIDFIIGAIGILLSVVFFLILSSYSNYDLSTGRYVLSMDEQITYDEIRKILNSNNLIELIDNIVNGDHRYGRITFYLPSLFSFVPTEMFGPKGQIISTRFFQTLVLLGAYLIISFTFFRFWSMKWLGLVLLLLMPTTLYYFTIPKPEPLQTLFFALFLHFSNKNNFKFGWYWVFMGLAFGAKISILPLIFMFAILSFFQHNIEVVNLSFWKKAYKSILFFCIGLLLAEPIFLKGEWNTYLNSTFKNTTHGSDDSTITLQAWLYFIYNEYFFVFVIFVIAILLLLVKIMELNFQLLQLKNLKIENIGYYYLVSGLFMMLIIMLKVDRLWYIYLHLPFLLVLIGTLMSFESFISYKDKIYKYSVLIVIVIVIFYFLFSKKLFKNIMN